MYIVGNAGQAGQSIAAIAVGDIEQTAATLRGRGVAVGAIAPEGDAGLKAVVHDPDGNTISILQVGARG